MFPISAAIGLAMVPMLASQAPAQSIVSRGESFVHAGIVPGDPGADGARLIGLRLDLAPHWKTYWRSPGEMGIPPTIDFSKSANLEKIEIFWPRPEVFESFGHATIGYSDEVVLPIRITPADPAARIDVKIDLDLGVCKDICVLETTSLSQSIPADLRDGGEIIARAMASVPKSGAAAGLSSATCTIAGAGKDRQFSAALTFDHPVSEPMVVLEGPEGVWFHDTESTAGGNRVDVTSTLSLMFDDIWVSRKGVRMTLLAEDMAADVQGCDAPAG
ncbi:hypothetical protein KHP62_00290 [Rhodobacteraceae bacterium NNCM2]|nr:hypothetical protein [Coraliihabitans acroporae]